MDLKDLKENTHRACEGISSNTSGTSSDLFLHSLLPFVILLVMLAFLGIIYLLVRTKKVHIFISLLLKCKILG